MLPRNWLTFTRNGQAIAPANSWWNWVDFRFLAGEMHKDERNEVYRVRNWSEYNAGLIAKGSVAMSIDDSILTDASEPGTCKRGRPCIYADAVI